MNKNVIIDYDHFKEVIAAIDFKLGKMEKLHWEICGCLSDKAEISVLDNLRGHRYKLEQAKKKLFDLFESQYK